MVDLHTHSNASDGELSPADLLELASESGVTALALTDHDTMSGLMEAEEKSRALGIRFIPGVETEVDFEPGEFHILGLGLNVYPKGPLDSFLENIRRRRVDRNEEMVSKMKADGLPVTIEELDLLAGGDVIGRMHFARWLIRHGKAKNVTDCFERWLGPGRPYNVPKNRPGLEEVLQAIHAAGGRAVIAHPLSLWISWGRMALYLKKWKEMGLDGVEARHSGASSREAARFEDLAVQNGMFITGGSDFHGPGRPDRRLGYGADGNRVPADLLKPFDAE
jgi:predicted metal-dependent phosphoesterase TrpH